MSRLRVLHILEATAGGTERHMELAGETLPRWGIDLQLIASPVRNPRVFETLGAHFPEGTPARAVRMRRSISPWGDLAAWWRISRLIPQFGPHVIHTHASKGGMLGRFAARGWTVPVVHTPHVFAMEWAGDSLAGRLYRRAERMAARWTDRLVVLHAEQERIARDELGLDVARIRFLPNGIDAREFVPPAPEERAGARRQFGIPPEGLCVGMAARLEPQKGVGNYLRAARRVLAAFPNTIFLLAGGGSLERQMKRRAERLGIGHRLRFLGTVEHMPAFYHALDVFVLASLWEGMPYAVLEAQASGLPVVASATSGVLALVNPGVTGTLTPVHNVDAMASAIVTYLREPMLRERVGRKARAFVEDEHRVEVWAARLAALYYELAGQPLPEGLAEAAGAARTPGAGETSVETPRQDVSGPA